MTKITEMRAAYFPPYVFASSGFFVQTEQMTSIKTHMADSPCGEALSDKETAGFGVPSCSVIFTFCYPSGGAQETSMLILQDRGFKMQIPN